MNSDESADESEQKHIVVEGGYDQHVVHWAETEEEAQAWIDAQMKNEFEAGTPDYRILTVDRCTVEEDNE